MRVASSCATLDGKSHGIIPKTAPPAPSDVLLISFRQQGSRSQGPCRAWAIPSKHSIHAGLSRRLIRRQDPSWLRTDAPEGRHLSRHALNTLDAKQRSVLGAMYARAASCRQQMHCLYHRPQAADAPPLLKATNSVFARECACVERVNMAPSHRLQTGVCAYVRVKPTFTLHVTGC